MSDWLLKLVKEIKKEVAKVLAQVHPDLPNRMGVEVVKTKSGESAELQITVPRYPWIWQLFGAKAHSICARLWRRCGNPSPLWPPHRAARALAIKTEHGVIFRRRVWHPGNKALWKTMRLKEKLEKAVINALKRVFG